MGSLYRTMAQMNAKLPSSMSREQLEAEIELISGLPEQAVAGKQADYAARLAALLAEWHGRLTPREQALFLAAAGPMNNARYKQRGT